MRRSPFPVPFVWVCPLAALVVSSVMVAACGRQPEPPPRAAQAPVKPAEPARIAIKVDRNIGTSLRMVDFSIAARTTNAWDDGWEITGSLEVLQLPAASGTVWLRAYRVSGDSYLTLDRVPADDATPPTPRVGAIAHERFVVPEPGAYNLYAGETFPDGRIGEAVPLGWIAVGHPASPAFLSAVRILADKGLASRAAAMVDQAFIDRPDADVPEDLRVALTLETRRFETLLPHYQRKFASGWRPARLDEWLAITAVVQTAGWKDNGPSFDEALKEAPRPLGAAAAMADAARLRAQGKRSSERPPYQLAFTPSVSVIDGLRAVGAAINPVPHPGAYEMYLFLQADKDMKDDAELWLHAYPLSGSAYIDGPARSVPHPVSLRRGDYTWRLFTFARDGAYTAFVGSAQNGSSGRSASLGWVAFGQSNSPQLIAAVEAIAGRGARQRATEIAEGRLLENPNSTVLEQWLQRSGRRATNTQPSLQTASR